MRWLFLVAASMLSACGGFDLDTHVRAAPGHALVMNGEGRTIDQSWSYFRYVDALEFPPTITVADSHGRDYTAELRVSICAADGDLDWEYGDFEYELSFGYDKYGEYRLWAGARSASCRNGERSTVTIFD